MKKTVFFTTLILAMSLFLQACQFGGGGNVAEFFSSETGKKSKNTSSGQELCKYDNECEETCEEIYDDSHDEENDGKVDACAELRYDLVMEFKNIMDALEDPYESKLKNIDHSDFFEFLDISVEPWVRSTEAREISPSQAEDLLVWVARENRISDALTRAYQNYETDFDKFEGVANLFEQVAPNFTSCSGEDRDCAEMFHAITETSIAGSHTSFRDIVEESSSSHGEAIYCEIFNRKCGEINGTPNCDVNQTEYDNFFDECAQL